MTLNTTTTCAAVAVLCASAHQASGQAVTILSQETVHTDVRAFVESDHLWLSEAALPAVTGFERKPEGLCLDELCIPMPADGSWESTREGIRFIDLSAFASQIGQPLVRDEEHDVWSLAQAPVLRSMKLEAGLAPDFVLPDRQGVPVRLSDLRGKKVLLLTWASW